MARSSPLCAIKALHAQNIIHADLHLHNILVDSELNSKLADFEGASFPGDYLGTASVGPQLSIKDFWSKPVLEWKEFAQVDIYCLGSIMYWILAGKTPFEGVEGYGADVDFLQSYKEGKFPDTSGLSLGNLILDISQGKVQDAGEILYRIAVCIPLPCH